MDSQTVSYSLVRQDETVRAVFFDGQTSRTMELYELSGYPFSLADSSGMRAEDAFRFIEEEPERLETLEALLQGVLDYFDKDYPTRQLVLCAEPETAFCWIAALSVLFPQELALRLTFSVNWTGEETDIVLCSVEQKLPGGISRKRVQLYDLTETDRLRHPAFCQLVETAFTGNRAALTAYHQFVTEQTSCHRPENAYAQGYSYFRLMQSGITELDDLEEAKIFAEKHMKGDALAKLLDKLLSGSIDRNLPGADFSRILTFAEQCIQKEAVRKETVLTRYLQFLGRLLLAEHPSHKVYQHCKQSIQSFCKRQGVLFEASFTNAMTCEAIQMLSGQEQWVSLELAGLLCRCMRNETQSFAAADKRVNALHMLLSGLLTSEVDRDKMIAALLQEFTTVSGKAAFLEFLQGLQADTAGRIAELLLQSGENRQELLHFLSEKPFSAAVFDALEEALYQRKNFSDAETLFSEMLDSHSCYAQFTERMLDVLSSLSMDDDPEKARSETYQIFCFARKHQLLGERLAYDLFQMYRDLLFEGGGWYDAGEETCQELTRMMDAVPEPVTDPAVYNVLLLYYIQKESESLGTALVYQRPSAFGKLDFSVMTPEEESICIQRIAKALCQRTLFQQSADIRCRYFLPLPEKPDADSPHDRIHREWFSLLLQEGKAQTLLLAQLLAIMEVYCELDLQTIGADCYHSGIRLKELTELLQSEEIQTLLRQNGVRHPQTASDTLTQGLTKAYDSARRSVPGEVLHSLKKPLQPFLDKLLHPED